MARQISNIKNSVFSYREESVRGTAETDSDNTKIVLARLDTVPTWTSGHEILESDYMDSTMGRSIPEIGMEGEDNGFMIPVWARTSGTVGTAPDFSLLLKHMMGAVSIGTGGVIAVSPAPTTTAITVTGLSGVVVNQILYIEYETDTWVARRVTSVASEAITVDPPLPSVSAGGTVTGSVTHLLKSLRSDFATGTGYFYHEGDKRVVFAGCVGSNLDISWEVGQRIGMELTMQSLSYSEDVTAIPYTVTPADYNKTTAPVCIGMYVSFFYKGTVVTGSTATSVIVTSPGGIEIEVNVDRIYVDISGTGAGEYESRIPSVVSGTGIGDKTCTVTALSGVPAAGDAVIVEHTECLPSFSLALENTIDKEMCMHPTSGYSGQDITDRVATIAMDNKRWRTLMERAKMLVSDPVEILLVAGTQDNGLFACDIPTFAWTEITRAEENRKLTQTENGGAYIVNGNDEFILGWID